MKRTAIAAAFIASCGMASAQSSVTLFGVVDATLAHGSGSRASLTQLTNSGLSSSRLGFRGIEDLGSGMKAGFHLEASILNDDGRTGGSIAAGNQATTVASGSGLNFSRRATLSIGNALGELRLGRDYTPQYYNVSVYDPFGTNGVGTNQIDISTLGGPVSKRASNTISYLWNHSFNGSPGSGGAGFHALVQHYRGENPSGTPTSSDGTGSGVRLGYNGGQFSVGLAIASTNYATGDIRSTNIGASYNFGVARVMAAISRDKVGAASRGDGYILGALVPAGSGTVRVAYSQYDTNAAGNPKTRKLALGYVYDLSKRTALYATIAQVRNSGGASVALNGASTAANQSSRGIDLGIRHVF